MTNEVVLRDVIEADLPILFEQQRDPAATMMACVPSREWDAFTAHWARILADEHTAKQVIILNEQVTGHILRFEHDGQPEVGYWLGQEYWGKGIATQALRAFLLLVTERPLYGHVVKDHLASLHVLQKCGFTIVGEDKAYSTVRGAEVEAWMLRLDAGQSDETR